jgi:hypothetical protein
LEGIVVLPPVLPPSLPVILGTVGPDATAKPRDLVLLLPPVERFFAGNASAGFAYGLMISRGFLAEFAFIHHSEY